MKMKKYLLILFIVSLAMTACAAENSADALLGAWVLESYGTVGSLSPAVPDTEAGITFNEDGTLGGNSGCNGFGGNYTVEGNQVNFSEIVSTLMFCDEPIGGQEEAFFQVLTDTAMYNVDGDTLTITNNDRALVFTR
jgi:heat shock protein HslJ